MYNVITLNSRSDLFALSVRFGHMSINVKVPCSSGQLDHFIGEVILRHHKLTAQTRSALQSKGEIQHILLLFGRLWEVVK